MNSNEVFVRFCNKALVAKKAMRYCELIKTKKGPIKILDMINHDIDNNIRNDTINTNINDNDMNSSCFIFHRNHDFGKQVDTLRAALDSLSQEEGWIVILENGSLAIYRPEGRWDAERTIRI